MARGPKACYGKQAQVDMRAIRGRLVGKRGKKRLGLELPTGRVRICVCACCRQIRTTTLLQNLVADDQAQLPRDW